MASVLALDGTDKGSIGAMAHPLQKAFGIGKTEIGLLLTASLLTGAAATLPMGWLVDRRTRTHLLAIVVVVWGVAILLAGTATSYGYLLVVRLLLAGVSAAAGPAVASLVGDFFPGAERASIYGLVLAGEFVGTGLGFLIAGELATWSWRAGFMIFSVPAWVLAWGLWKLPEPARGGAGRMAAGQGSLRAEGGHQCPDSSEGKARSAEIQQRVRELGVVPRSDLLLDPKAEPKRSLLSEALYVLRIPTNVVLILGSTLGYLYLAGMRTFGVEYLEEWFGVQHPAAVVLALLLGLGAMLGVLVSGRVADYFLKRGKVRARVVGVVISTFLLVAMLLIGLWVRPLWLAMLWLTLAAAALGSANPPLDAARLDIMPSWLWGIAEAVRTALRQSGEAISPLLFGYFADHLGHSHSRGGDGLHWAFLIMLVSPFCAGLMALISLRTYPRDVATAGENTRRWEQRRSAQRSE